MSEQPSVDDLLDLFVYFPLGVLLQFQEDYPDYVAKGRAAMDTQGAMYKTIGEFALNQVKGKAEEHAGGLYDILSSIGLIERRDEPAPQEPPPAEGDEPADAAQPAEGDGDVSLDNAAASAPVQGADGGPDGSSMNGTVTAHEVDDLAIADYDTLPAAQIVPLLAGLDAAERAAIGRYEAAHRGRRTVLGRIERLAERDGDHG